MGTKIRKRKPGRGAPKRLAFSVAQILEIVDRSPDGVLVADIGSGRFVWGNARICAMLQRTREEVTALSVDGIHPPDELARVKAAFKSQAEGRFTLAMDIPLLRKDGTVLMTDVNSYPIPLDGRPHLVGLFRDATTRLEAGVAARRMEQALALSEERFRSVADLAADAIITTDARGVIIFYNKSAERLFGIPPAEAVGRSIEIIIPGDVKPAHAAAWQRAVAHGGGLPPGRTFETRARRADGTPFDVEVSLSSWATGDGRFYTVIVRDIAERKVHERALRESEARFRELAEMLPEPVFETDTRGNLTFVNQAGFMVSGHPPDSLFRRFNARELLVPGDRTRGEELLRGILAGTVTGGIEFSALRRDGSTFPVIISSTPIIRDGRVVGARGIVIDITERKRMERELAAARDELELRVLERTAELLTANRELKESEEKFRGLFESSRDAIMTCEPPSWRFTSGNPATVNMFRAKDGADFISYEPWRLSPERQPDGRASVDKAKEMLETAMHTGSHFFEWVHKRIDGEEFPASVLLTRVEQAGKSFVQATVRDLTEHKRLERQAIQDEKMAAVGTLVASLSHELNNPLGIILGYAQGSLRRLPDESPLRAPLEAIEREARRTAGLVRSLLDFSRHEPSARERTDPAAILARIRELAAGIARAQEVAFEAPAPPGGLPAILACPAEIESAVFNLVVNAFDATPAGGRVGVTLAATARDGRPGVAYTVADSGEGIPAGLLTRIFEPFFTTKPPGRGTGLGLSIVTQIAEAHEGRVDVESTPGAGTTMHLWLPAADGGDT